MNDKITTRSKDYSRWYLDIVEHAGMAVNSDVRGCMVIKPHGYAIWERMQRALDRMFKDTGHVNAYFPLFIPKSFFEREEEMAAGFAKECAVVTHHRLKVVPGEGLIVDPDSKLEEPLIIRPTSETIIWNTYKTWIQSYRDLPLLINQWCNVVRWEMRPRLFLRTAEFLWQEGHTAHATQKEAEDEAHKLLEVYRKFAEEWMAMPVLMGTKTEGQKFPGAVYTLCIEAMMQDKKALQAGTSHFLGQNFAKAFDVKFQSQAGHLEYAWATSWGVSTRLIGGLIMTHSDDAGLLVPPRLAPIHVVIVPLGKSDDEKQTSLKAAEELKGAIVNIPREEFFGYEPLVVEIDKHFRFFRIERLEVLKKVDMLCTLEVTQKQPSRGKTCPPAYCITCSAFVATSAPKPITSRAAPASSSSNHASGCAAPNAAQQMFMPRDTRIASSERCPSASGQPSSFSRWHG